MVSRTLIQAPPKLLSDIIGISLDPNLFEPVNVVSSISRVEAFPKSWVGQRFRSRSVPKVVQGVLCDLSEGDEVQLIGIRHVSKNFVKVSPFLVKGERVRKRHLIFNKPCPFEHVKQPRTRVVQRDPRQIQRLLVGDLSHKQEFRRGTSYYVWRQQPGSSLRPNNKLVGRLKVDLGIVVGD